MAVDSDEAGDEVKSDMMLRISDEKRMGGGFPRNAVVGRFIASTSSWLVFTFYRVHSRILQALWDGAYVLKGAQERAHHLPFPMSLAQLLSIAVHQPIRKSKGCQRTHTHTHISSRAQHHQGVRLTQVMRTKRVQVALHIEVQQVDKVGVVEVRKEHHQLRVHLLRDGRELGWDCHLIIIISSSRDSECSRGGGERCAHGRPWSVGKTALFARSVCTQLSVESARLLVSPLTLSFYRCD